MKSKSIASIVLAVASLACAGWAAAGEHAAPRRAAHDPAQARLTVAQAVTIAEVLGKGSARKIEWDPRSAVYRIELASADGRHRDVQVEAHGGRLVDGSSR